MKELSIEEKAKAYDEAIERAREWYNELEPDSYTCVVESIFPEFKEIDNEKIRKRIIALVNAYGQGMYKDEMLAWLEKQDEPNPYSGVSFKYNGHTWGMCARDNGVEILVDGEIKERVFLDSKPQGKSALEAINEEKVDNANKVEPKFKVEKDKWYVCTSQYCNCIEGRNYKASLDGRIIDDYGTEYDIHSDAYRWFRPWTIQDAKDGDVLSWDDSKCITIFKNIYDKDSFNSYGFVGSCTGTFESRIAYHDIKGAHPATREQRDLLFTKMEEAGYEWNARKKELNKVEQKKAIHKELTEFEKAVKQVMEEAIECGDTHNLKADADMLLSLVQKPAWSEEDENILDAITYTVKNSGYKHCIGVSNEMMITFIESLKQRYTWKPSNEYINALEYFIRSLGESDYSSSYSYDSKMELLRLLLFDLKKLKE
jgi:hypothetical protein